MRRRELLGGLAATGAAGLAGCAGFDLQQPTRAPPLVEDRPDAVYLPTHVEGMNVPGTASGGPYECALTYSYAHRFWLVTGDRSNQVHIEDSDSMHLMPIVWHRETGIVPPDLSPKVRIRRDGEDVTSLSPWPMLSQPMGFHFGDNVALPGEGTYQVEISVGEGSADRTGSLADAGPASFEFSMPYSRSKKEEITYRDLPSDRQGTAGAVPPMEMDALPSTQLPEADGLPGTVRGTASTGDGRFVVTTLDDATRFGASEDETYLAVSARTPYNRYPLPLMSLSATLKRGGETVYDDALRAAIDPDLRSHYGAVLSGVESGDELTITVDAPPQTARHEGYETAFLKMPAVTLTLE
ncbi:MAG: iron transporter [Haloferacaceae archaeon]